MELRFCRRAIAVVFASALIVLSLVTTSPLVAWAGSSVTASAPFKSYENFTQLKKNGQKPKIGQIYRIDPMDMRPTQFAVGQEEVDSRADALKDLSDSKRHAYLERKVGRVVIGPGGTPWIVDGHHLARVLKETGHDSMLVQVSADWSNLSMPEFFKRMEKENYVWLYDENGIRRPASELPKNIGKLKDDPYRSLARTVSKRGGFEKSSVPFQEFIWANYFRKHISTSLLKEHPEKAVEQAMMLAASPDAKQYPGYRSANCVIRGVAEIEKH